jgi:flagellar motor switch protein FliG
MDQSASDNLRKAAIVVSALGEDLAVEICGRLPVGQVLKLGEEVARLERVEAEEASEVIDEFLVAARDSVSLGGGLYAKQLLNATLGPSGSANQLKGDDPEGLSILSRLNEMEPLVLWRALRDEKRQTIAAVLSRLTATKAGQLLSNFEDDMAADIAYRAAHLSNPSPGAMQALAGSLDLELRAAHARAGSTPEMSLQFVVDLIASMPPAKGKQMLEALVNVDKDFGNGVAEQVFTFDDIGHMADHDMQIVLRSVDMNILVVALKGTSLELRERVKANLSKRGQERLEEELEMLGPVPVTQVQDAQRQICHEARTLAEAGEINLDSGTVEYVE